MSEPCFEKFKSLCSTNKEQQTDCSMATIVSAACAVALLAVYQFYLVPEQKKTEDEKYRETLETLKTVCVVLIVCLVLLALCLFF